MRTTTGRTLSLSLLCAWGLTACPKDAAVAEPGPAADAPASDPAATSSTSSDETTEDDDALIAEMEARRHGEASETHPIPKKPVDDGEPKVTALTITPSVRGGTCKPEGLGGWDGTPECKQIAKRWAGAPARDFACKADADCTPVGMLCAWLPMSSVATEDDRYRARPCMDPTWGACNPNAKAPPVACVEGCCRFGGGGKAKAEQMEYWVKTAVQNAVKGCGLKAHLIEPVDLEFRLGHDAPTVLTFPDEILEHLPKESAGCLRTKGKRSLRPLDPDQDDGYVYDVRLTLAPSP